MRVKVGLLAAMPCCLGIAWLLMSAGTLLPAEPLSVDTLQSAYEREASTGDKRHDKGLKLISADCVADQTKAFLCWVKFVSADDSNQRLYFDAVTMARENGQWTLKSGLCKS